MTDVCYLRDPRAPPIDFIQNDGGGMLSNNLQRSHFSTHQDDRAVRDQFSSTQKVDYLPLPVDRIPPVKQQDAGRILPTDHRIHETTTESKREYPRRDFDIREQTNSTVQLTRTNFHAHGDLSKNVNWSTTQKQDFPPHPVNQISKSQPNYDLKNSSIPNGDPEKVPEPLTDYKDRFRAHDLSRTEPYKPPPQKPTISGDQRQNEYCTTNKDAYQPSWTARVRDVMRPQNNDIFGTAGLPFSQKSESAYEFVRHNDARSALMNQNLSRTNFRLDDGTNRFNDWTSTQKDSFQPGDTQRPVRPTVDSNASAVPLGGRPGKEDWITNYNRYHTPKEVTRRRPVEGNNQVSQVVIGMPEENEKYYETTQRSSFMPVRSAPADSTRSMAYKTNVPLDYDAGFIGVPEYRDEYGGYRGVTRDEVTKKLQKSNIQFPHSEDQFWQTTHKSDFTPVQSSKRGVEFDAGRLQRSNVPMGTMQH